MITSTTIAQAIPIAISPILTRIYTPEEFGILALYLALVTILSVIVAGRYEFAILLPKKNKEAKSVLILACLITSFISFILLLIVYLFNIEITKLLGNEKISSWLYFVPFTVFLSGIYQSFNYWINRNKYYNTIARNKIIQSSITSFSHLSIGGIGYSNFGLIIGQFFGQIVSTFIFVQEACKKDKFTLNKLNMLKSFVFLKKYSKFPKIDIPATLLNVSSHQLTHLFFNGFFNASIAGYFYLTQRILGVPISIISSSITSVFQEQASIDFKMKSNARDIFLITFKKMILLVTLPTLFFYYYAIDLFVIIFGEKWEIAGYYAQILTPMFFLQFISSPLNVMFYIGERQEWNLYIQILLILFVICSFYFVDTPLEVVKLLSLSFSMYYILQLIASFKIAGFTINKKGI